MAVGPGRIQLPNTPNPPSGQAYSYFTSRGRPVLFQVTDPTNQPLFPYLLAMHVNPGQLEEGFHKSKVVAMTRGGFVEWNWPDELDSLSASATTGAFLGPDTGLTSGSDGKGSTITGSTRRGSAGRQGTMAWERQEDLLDLFHNNGAVYDGNGQPVIRGRVMLIYDRGIFLGHFTNFDVKETDDKAFSFQLDWEFKIEETIYSFTGSTQKISPGDNTNSDTRQTMAQSSQFEAQLMQGTSLGTSGNGDKIPPPQLAPRRPDETDDQFNARRDLFNSAFGDGA
jgi:hypothetical protein